MTKIILWGEPASGKTTIANAMASLFDQDNCVFSHAYRIPTIKIDEGTELMIIDECKDLTSIRLIHALLEAKGYTGNLIFCTQAYIDHDDVNPDQFTCIKCTYN